MIKRAAMAGAFLVLTSSVCAAAAPWNVTLHFKLPNGAPAKASFVRMYYVGANYMIVSVATKTADASGTVVFKVPRTGLCFKAEYGNDGAGRPTHVGGTCVKDHESSQTVVLD